jgi:pyridoxal phosphate enzyme (YggS family)
LATETKGTASDPTSNLESIQARIDEARKGAIMQPPQEVSIVAVGKRQPVSRIEALLDAGHRIFGESRVQEAQEKWPELRIRAPNVELHMVGPLQTNKAADAVSLFDVIHSLDRPKLALKLGSELAKTGHRPRLLIQVNTGEEPQKAGVRPGNIDEFVHFCRHDCGLDIAGLMCIPPVNEEPSMHFVLLARIARRHKFAALSMGMSGDFKTAVQFGATHVRVGTALFGSRPS